VSHDRAFLDNVVTQTLAAEGDGIWKRVRRRLQRLDAQGPERIRADRLRGEAIEHELDAAFARWAELDARVTALKQG
jgi:ABC transport system ATP-binding/permease protein